MEEIDWSKAPEDATHYMPEHRCFVRPSERKGLWFEVNTGCVVASQIGLIERQSPSWNGQGMPPVGTVCEIAASTGYLTNRYPEGAKVKVYANFTDDRGIELAAFIDADGTVGGVAIGKCFRPIRTPEQIAADEREAAVEAMLLLDPYLPNIQLGMMSRADFCRALYADGYRKP